MKFVLSIGYSKKFNPGKHATPFSKKRDFFVYNQQEDLLGNEVRETRTKEKRTVFWVPKIQKEKK